MTNDSTIGFIGTYTKGESKGIYSFQFDKKISNVKLAGEIENPTYVTISNDQKYLYAVMKKGEQGGVASFSINKKEGTLTFLTNQLSEGTSPCHVSLGKEDQYLFASYYHRGTIESYPINVTTGQIEEISSSIKHGDKEKKAHVHYASITPDRKFVVVVDLGLDKIFTYAFEHGILKEKEQFLCEQGSGPRHLTFHPNGHIAYCMTEFSSEIYVLKYSQVEGSFKLIHKIRTIPDNFHENNQGSAIHITTDGKFVYAANRGHHSIAIFEVGSDDGTLSLVDIVHTEGNWPRDFSLDPSEQYLIVANQESSNLTLFQRHQETGKLTLLQKDIFVPTPTCVKFLQTYS